MSIPTLDPSIPIILHGSHTRVAPGPMSSQWILDIRQGIIDLYLQSNPKTESLILKQSWERLCNHRENTPGTLENHGESTNVKTEEGIPLTSTSSSLANQLIRGSANTRSASRTALPWPRAGFAKPMGWAESHRLPGARSVQTSSCWRHAIALCSLCSGCSLNPAHVSSLKKCHNKCLTSGPRLVLPHAR
jgi:hypothetical protein